MKTIHSLCLAILGCGMLLVACTKEAQEPVTQNNQQTLALSIPHPNPSVNDFTEWREDFSFASSLYTNWNLYGTQLPKWVPYAFNRYGLFDNNGLSPDGSYAISRNRIGQGTGYTIESSVYIDLTNPKGSCICPGIGVTKYLDPLPLPGEMAETGIMMRLRYIGGGVTSVPVNLRNHTYVQMSVILEDGVPATPGDYKLQADFIPNGWHKIKIMVDEFRQVSFYLDDQKIWSPGKPILESLMRDKNILLGFTSPGSAGKAYHDWVCIINRLPS